MTLKKQAPLRPLESVTDLCHTCGTCSAICPLTGARGFNPRKIVHMAIQERDQEITDSPWPWMCTLCGRCEHACPMGINIVNIMRTARGMVEREKVPVMLQKGIELGLETGNYLGLPDEDFKFIIDDVGAELAEQTGFEDFQVPFDKRGANLLHTLHNKLVNTQNEDLVHWWKIFHAAGEDWTIPSQNWEGCNWGYFSGDDEVMKIFVGRIVEHMENLEIKNLMYPE